MASQSTTGQTTYRVLITGASGFAGGAVLKLCLDDSRVSAVTSVGRKAPQLQHPKHTAVVHADFNDQSTIADHYRGLDAVFFCLGISQSDVPDEARYREITYDYTLESARQLKEQSPRAVFHFLSGAGTNVNGRFMWQRIKGEAERDLSSMGLGGAVHYRPALIVGHGSETARYAMEKWLRPLEFLYRPFRSLSIRTAEFGSAMVQAMVEGQTDAVLENRDLRALAARYRSPVGPAED